MRLQRLIAILACLTIFSPRLVQAQARILMRADRYLALEYSQRPESPADYVFFQGEPIELQLNIINDGAERVSVSTPSLSGSQISLIVQRFTDGSQAISADAEIHEPPTVNLEHAAYVADRSRPVELPTAAMLTVRFRMEGQLEPGRYSVSLQDRIRIEPSASRVVIQSDSVGIEVRPVRSSEARFEFLYRMALRAVEAQSYSDAQSFVSKILSEYPSSSAALTVSALIAEKSRRVIDALTAYRRALQLLETGADIPYLSRQSRRVVEQKKAGLRAAIARIEATRQPELR